MVLEYVSARLGDGAVTELLDRCGETRTAAELSDDTRWSSYAEFRPILEEAARMLGGVECLAEVSTSDVSSTMPDIAGMVQAFGSPAALFASMPDGESALARILLGKTEEVGPADWRLSVGLMEGFEPFPELCTHLGAVMAASVGLFGLEATYEEERCQCRGDDMCCFRLRWDESADLGSQLRFARADADVVRHRLELFQQSIGDIVSSDDLDSVLRRVVRIGSRSTVAPVFMLSLEPGAGTSRSLYAVGVDDDEADAVAARALAEPLDDTIVVEVTSAGRHYGHVLAVGSPPALVASERPLLESYARLAAAALDSAYALDEARRQAAAARALLDLSTSLGDIASPRELAVRVVRAIPAVMGCDGAAMLLVDDGVAHMAAHHGFDPGLRQLLDKVTFPVDASAEHPVRIHLIEDAPEPLAGIMRATEVVALATSPVAIDGAVLGFLVATVDEDPDRLLRDRQIADRFAGLAGQAAVALRNGLLLDRIRHQSLHDPLTGLPNRALIIDRAEQMLARARRNRSASAVLFLDLDGFKEVNDTLGHGVGDQLLCSVASRLATALRSNDTVGRLGGDEFVVLTDGLSLDAGPEVVAERLLDVLRSPFELDGRDRPLMVSASIGIALGDRECADDLLRDADIALYSAKASGKNCFRIFADEMQAAVTDRADLTHGLQRAMANDEFALVYQPIFDLHAETVTSVEALIRWHHPERGVVGPDAFIPLLEETGLIVEVGRWVLREACRQTAAWHAAGWRVGVSVNASIRQLERPEFVEHVRDALNDAGLSPNALTIEITETSIMRDADATVSVLSALKDVGVRIAIDDFGTGYSSLAYLRRFPVDALKIDQSFIKAIAESRAAGELIHTLVSLGKALHLETLAEGIEQRAQFERLQMEGCDSGQGFIFARPLDADAVAPFLAEHLTPSSVS
jgi:diguanylate cyclase (GGDEF)-like protein